MMESIAAASMQMSAAQFQNAYATSLMKKSMDSAEEQAVSLINDMLEAVPAPSEYTFDVRV